MKTIFDEPIPTIPFPAVKDYCIRDTQENIVSLSESGFVVRSQYYEQGLPGSYKDCYARESVATRLKDAQKLLPAGLKFAIYDAYRPICVQQRLWNHYYNQISSDFPAASVSELEAKTGFFASKPSYDSLHPSLHNTGGAVDLTIITDNGYALNMGTLFDDFSDRAWTNHFEEFEPNKEVMHNRRILYHAMIAAGFTNLPSEWWHYDYGTKFWGYFTGKDALYCGILDADFPNRFPLC